MSVRIPRRNRRGYFHRKGNTPYKWYMDKDKIMKLKYEKVVE